jgi:hypothetical protein
MTEIKPPVEPTVKWWAYGGIGVLYRGRNKRDNNVPVSSRTEDRLTAVDHEGAVCGSQARADPFASPSNDGGRRRGDRVVGGSGIVWFHCDPRDRGASTAIWEPPTARNLSSDDDLRAQLPADDGLPAVWRPATRPTSRSTAAPDGGRADRDRAAAYLGHAAVTGLATGYRSRSHVGRHSVIG